MTLQIKFGCNRPAGLGDIHVWKCGRTDGRTDAGSSPILRWAKKPLHGENLFTRYANNKGTDQPAHLRSLISAFVVCCVNSTIPLVSITEISSLYLASVAVQAGLSLTWLEIPEDRFSRDWAHCIYSISKEWNIWKVESSEIILLGSEE